MKRQFSIVAFVSFSEFSAQRERSAELTRQRVMLNEERQRERAQSQLLRDANLDVNVNDFVFILVLLLLSLYFSCTLYISLCVQYFVCSSLFCHFNFC